MKKLLLTDWKKVQLVEAPIPEPGPGQAVVRIKYAGICGSDLHVFDGKHPSATVPLVMGHEACGQLYAIHDPRGDIQVGDLVCVHFAGGALTFRVKMLKESVKKDEASEMYEIINEL